MDTVFTKDGKPFFPLGGQCHNSNSQSPQELEVCWRALEALHANTAEIPVYWYLLEPEEGRFDFTQVDFILEGARSRGLQLILLWFATWKNGKMQYCPGWVKTQPERFQRVLTHDGVRTGVLSSHCRENLEADKRAFVALMGHLRQVDGQGTVIAVQVENEPGIDARSMRDHGPDGERDYRAPVPGALLEHIAGLPEDSRVKKSWRQAGSHNQGDWRQTFGTDGDEFLSSWSVASYINEVAKAGKAIHPVPMIVNVWNCDVGFNFAGIDYPAGGAVAKVLDLWKFASPDIDILGPDIYLASPKMFGRVCGAFARPDNPLFIPESPRRKSNEWGIIHAVGNYGAVGYCMFGVEDILLEDGSVVPDFRSAVDSFRMTADAIPLILRYAGRFHTILQEEGMTYQLLDLEGYTCNVQFSPAGKTDYRHRFASTRWERGRGYLFQAGPNEFYCVGDSFTFDLRAKPAPGSPPYESHYHTRHSTYLAIEDGHFADDGNWVVDRVRSGDDLDFGVWMYADNRVVRVVLYD